MTSWGRTDFVWLQVQHWKGWSDLGLTATASGTLKTLKRLLIMSGQCVWSSSISRHHFYYRRYINRYANIAQPLYNHTQKDANFKWPAEVQKVLIAPVLTSFVKQTDASATGLAVVLKLIGHVIVYLVTFCQSTSFCMV